MIVAPTGNHAVGWLALDELTADDCLAQRLPRELAWRYHVVPVAEDGGRLTVAMADPYDQAAQAAVVEALGVRPYVVQGDRTAIDQLLARVWPEEAPNRVRVLAWVGDEPTSDQTVAYAQEVGRLLGSEVLAFQPESAGTAGSRQSQPTSAGSRDLIVVDEQCGSQVEGLYEACSGAGFGPGSVLLVQGPRWPLRKVLLVAQAGETNGMTLEWAGRLARPSGATVTVLVMVPGQAQGLTALLDTQTALGQKTRYMARQLSQWEVEGTLRLCQGEAELQVRSELNTGEFDLVIVSAEAHHRWLRRVDRPVLLAGQKTA